MTSVNPAISSLLKDLLHRARAEGSLDMVVAEILADHDGFEVLSSGGGESMTDASKRRMTSPPEAESVVSGPNETKNVVGDSPHSFGAKLPQGITDLDHWGKTVLQVGKYERANMTYFQISESDRKEHSSYCAWMVAQRFRVDLTAPIKDFIRYLIVKGLPDETSEICFDGSTVRRKMKS